MYVHQVFTGPEFTGMRHIRQPEHTSGLVLPAEIGKTVAILRPVMAEQRNPAEFDLFTPTPNDIAHVAESRNEDRKPQPPEFPEEIESADLYTFVASGVARWEKLIETIGTVGNVQLYLKEHHTISEKTSKTGVVLPHTLEYEFDAYEAEEEEIRAMENVRNGAVRLLHNSGNTRTGTGHYM